VAEFAHPLMTAGPCPCWRGLGDSNRDLCASQFSGGPDGLIPHEGPSLDRQLAPAKLLMFASGSRDLMQEVA
jgi:hypothetical protein